MDYIGVNENKWYEEATRSRARLRALCHSGVAAHQDEIQEAQGHRTVSNVVCEVCCRKFRRESDKKRHKCLDERQKPVNEQRGAVHCHVCLKWFKSKGGLAVHRCNLPCET